MDSLSYGQNVGSLLKNSLVRSWRRLQVWNVLQPVVINSASTYVYGSQVQFCYQQCSNEPLWHHSLLTISMYVSMLLSPVIICASLPVANCLHGPVCGPLGVGCNKGMHAAASASFMQPNKLEADGQMKPIVPNVGGSSAYHSPLDGSISLQHQLLHFTFACQLLHI